VIAPILDVYGDAGFIVLVGLAMGAIMVLLFRLSRPAQHVEARPAIPLHPIVPCGKCDGTGRYADASGGGWPCLEPIHTRFEEAA
jgi:hypothetical protein